MSLFAWFRRGSSPASNTDAVMMAMTDHHKDPLMGAIKIFVALGMLVATGFVVWHIVWHFGEFPQQLLEYLELSDAQQSKFKGVAYIPYVTLGWWALLVLWISNSLAAKDRPVTRWKAVDWTFKWVFDWLPSAVFFGFMTYAFWLNYVWEGRFSLESQEANMLLTIWGFSIYDTFWHQRENTSEAWGNARALVDRMIAVKPGANDMPEEVVNRGIMEVIHPRGTFLKQGDKMTPIEGGALKLPPLIIEPSAVLVRPNATTQSSSPAGTPSAGPVA